MVTETERRPMTAEERAERLAELNEELNEAVLSLADSDAWRRMMDTASRFPRYSFRNQVLLWLQAEEREVTITQVAPFGVWKKLGYRIVKGSKAFKVYAPVKSRLRPDEIAKWQAEGTNPFDKDNKPRMVLRGFKLENVFDVAQVEAGPDAKPLKSGPSWVAQHGPGPEGVWPAIVEAIQRAGFELEHRPSIASDGGAHGWVDYSRQVVWIDSACDEAEAVRIGAHEVFGHMRCQHDSREITRAQRETEADSVAFLVLRWMGLNIGSSTISYLAGWSGGDADVLMAAGEMVRKVAGEVIAELEARLSA